MADLEYEIGFGASALDQQQALDRLDGYAVISGYAVTAGSGLTVDVTAGSATFGTTGDSLDTVSKGSATTGLNIPAANGTHPRRDVIYADLNGEPQVKQGTARSKEPDDQGTFDTWKPEPHDMHDVEGVVLAEVWVPAGATNTESSHIRDRRVPASIPVETLIAQDVFAATLDAGTLASALDADGNDVTNIGQLSAADGTVTNAPTASTDIVRKTDLDTTESNLQSDIDSHSTRHENGGADEVDATGLSVDASGNTTDNHSARHEDGGADEVDVTGLSGDLADPQDPKAHATTHQEGGADVIDAADLSGASGTDGQVLQTDGTSASWAASQESTISKSVITGATKDTGDVSIDGGTSTTIFSVANSTIVWGSLHLQNANPDQTVTVTWTDATTSDLPTSQHNPGRIDLGNLGPLDAITVSVDGSISGDRWASWGLYYE